MGEKQYKYMAEIKQPQTVGNVNLNPNGGVLSEREYKTLKKDAYGVSLLEKGLLIVEELPFPKRGRSRTDVGGGESSGSGEK